MNKGRTDFLINRLKREILTGSWEIGSRIPPEHELSLIYRVGRNTVREAIKALSYSGLLEVRQGSGTYVRGNIDMSELAHKMTSGSLAEHFEMRCLIESEAAKIAAKRRTDKDIERIRICLENRIAYNHDEISPETIERDIDFHLAIAMATGNSSLLLLYRFFSMSVRNSIINALTLIDNFEPDTNAHQRVLNAIISGDGEAAERAVNDMINPVIMALNLNR